MFAVREPLRSSRHPTPPHRRRLSEAIRARDPRVLGRGDRNPDGGQSLPAALVLLHLPAASTVLQRGDAAELPHGAAAAAVAAAFGHDRQFAFPSLRPPRLRGRESVDGPDVFAGLCILSEREGGGPFHWLASRAS